MEDKGNRLSLQFSSDDEDAIRAYEFLKLLGRKKSTFITELVIQYLESDEAKSYLVRTLMSEKEKNKEKRKTTKSVSQNKTVTSVNKKESTVQYVDISDDIPKLTDSDKRERRMAGLAMFSK